MPLGHPSPRRRVPPVHPLHKCLHTQLCTPGSHRAHKIPSRKLTHGSALNMPDSPQRQDGEPPPTPRHPSSPQGYELWPAGRMGGGGKDGAPLPDPLHPAFTSGCWGAISARADEIPEKRVRVRQAVPSEGRALRAQWADCVPAGVRLQAQRRRVDIGPTRSGHRDLVHRPGGLAVVNGCFPSESGWHAGLRPFRKPPATRTVALLSSWWRELALAGRRSVSPDGKEGLVPHLTCLLTPGGPPCLPESPSGAALGQVGLDG